MNMKICLFALVLSEIFAVMFLRATAATSVPCQRHMRSSYGVRPPAYTCKPTYLPTAVGTHSLDLWLFWAKIGTVLQSFHTNFGLCGYLCFPYDTL